MLAKLLGEDPCASRATLCSITLPVKAVACGCSSFDGWLSLTTLAADSVFEAAAVAFAFGGAKKPLLKPVLDLADLPLLFCGLKLDVVPCCDALLSLEDVAAVAAAAVIEALAGACCIMLALTASSSLASPACTDAEILAEALWGKGWEGLTCKSSGVHALSKVVPSHM